MLTVKPLAWMCRRSAKDFEDFGRLVANKYLIAHSRNPHYKALLKTLFKAALAPLPVQVLFCIAQRWQDALMCVQDCLSSLPSLWSVHVLIMSDGKGHNFEPAYSSLGLRSIASC